MRIKWKHKIYSGALQFTIFTSVIIALLLAGVILLTYTHRFFIEQSRAAIDNIQLADTGILLLQNRHTVSPDTISIEIPDTRNEQSVDGHLSHWGIYEKAYIKTTHRKKRFIKCALLGTGMNTDYRPALYLAETNKPLMVAGHTRIEGNAFLPEMGIRTGNIKGHSYYNNQLIYGTVQNSSTTLPQLQYDYRTLGNYYLEDYEPLNDNYFMYFTPGSITEQSFTEPTKFYSTESTVVIDNITLKGNIIIRSAEKIVITPSAHLNDIILVAPVIEIQDNVNGNFQAFADTTIKIGKNCMLNYPSALVLIEDKVKSENTPGTFNRYLNKLLIEESSTIKGTVCFIKDPEKESDYNANIIIAKNSLIKGEIYCEKNLELRGSVYGSVYAEQLLTYEDGTNFINHLYDVSIISSKLPEVFGGILLENKQKTVVKWVY